MTDKTPSAPAIISVDDVLSCKFMADKLDSMTVVDAFWLTIHALQDDLDGTDLATAKLALEVAKRIDADGRECGISLYNRLHSLLLDLQHKERKPKCPLAPQPVATE